MKSEGIHSYDGSQKIVFNGKRIYKNVVSQLLKDNPYSLSEPNQRYITNAIAELGKIKGEKNIEFLMKTAAKSTYVTHIGSELKPKNDWIAKLLTAAGAAVAITPEVDAMDIYGKMVKIWKSRRLSTTEREILKLEKELIKSVDLKQIKDESFGGAKDFVKNLEYFIISSETTLKDKKYILERLNYFMSDEYSINPDLKDKKSVAVAEMVSDMAIAAPNHEIPNIKAVNQKQHGICAAIAIVRKKLVYEDKRNYVDSIISELDSSEFISVYDRSELGSGKKTLVTKVPVDFKTALENGYRIIDASAMHWMQIAEMVGSSTSAYSVYNPFDKENFGVKTDSFFNVKIANPELEILQDYYQALIKSQDLLQSYKANKIKSGLKKQSINESKEKTLEMMGKTRAELKALLKALLPDMKTEDINSITSGMLSLERKYSDQIKPEDKFGYIHNEEEIMKKGKIKDYIISKTGLKDISSKDIDTMWVLVDYYQGLRNSISRLSERVTNISKARRLFELGAAFRLQVVKGLEHKETLENMMRSQGLPDRETLLLDTIDILIEKLEKKVPYSNIIIEHLNKTLDDNIVVEADAIESLKMLKNQITELLTSQLDEIYESLTLVDRKNALNTYIVSNQQRILDGDEQLLVSFAEMLGVKKDKDTVLNALEQMRQEMNDGDYYDYADAFAVLGNTSQIEIARNMYDNIVAALSEEGNDELLAKFLTVNGLPFDVSEDKVVGIFQGIEGSINAYEAILASYNEILKIKAPNGEILFSAEPKDIIIKKMENAGHLPSYSALNELQEHLAKIQKDRSQDEFQSRQGKLKDKSLYKFSNAEKTILKELEASINTMYAYNQKQLKSLRRAIKAQLEELKRQVGVNSGTYWVNEGSSGLIAGQQVRILEYMTGRPHYVNNNVKDAIEKIKTSPYSGVSSSSVFHNDLGMHAQYIADIAPVKVKVTDKDGNISEETKEVLYHDNTWGASEVENTWVDSYGLKRTDYSDNRGGTLGYITNEKYRNGNFVDRIINEMVVEAKPDFVNSKVYKRLKPREAEYKTTTMPQYVDVIMDGQSPELKDFAEQIHDTLFQPSTGFVQTISVLSAASTQEELKHAMDNIDSASKGWEDKYNALRRRILSKTENSVKTKEDYDKLPDNDYLKVVLEKIALKKNAQIAGLEPELALVKNVKDLDKFKKEQRRRALESFKYSFSKTQNILEYISSKFDMKVDDSLRELITKLNLGLTEDQEDSIGSKFDLDIHKMDGSLRKSINLVLQALNNDMKDVVKDENARRVLRNFFRKFFENTMYFNKSDLNNKTIEHIIKFIDRVYDPADDEEFVEIYRQIQDMTKQEFKEKILSQITREDLGIKNITGYDILKKIQMYDETAESDLMNQVYYDILVPNLNSEEYSVKYSYGKLNRVAKYLTKYNFNTTYRTLKNDLELLTYEKLFNKYKAANLNKYGVYPAYPKLDYMPENIYQGSFNSLITQIQNAIQTVRTINEQIENYSLTRRLKTYMNKLEDSAVLTDYQYKNLNMILGRFVTINYADPALENAVNAAEDAMELAKGTQFGEYRKYLEIVRDVIANYEITAPKEKLIDMADGHKESIPRLIENYVGILTESNYRTRMTASFNEFTQAVIKNKDSAAEMIPALYEEFKKHHIMNNPKDLLRTYVLSCAKDSDSVGNKSQLEQLITRALTYSKLADIQSILMEAIDQGLETDTKKKFSSYNVELINDTSVPMDSEDIIKQMVHALVIDSNEETALMFLDKLGLGETYVEYTSDNIDFEMLKGLMNEAVELTNNYTEFQNHLVSIFKDVQDSLDENSDIIKIVDSLKRKILRASKKLSVKKEYISKILEALDTIKVTCLENPEGNKGLLFKKITETAIVDATAVVNEKLTEVTNVLQSNETIINLINQVPVAETGAAYQARIRLNENYKALVEYGESIKYLPAEEESDTI